MAAEIICDGCGKRAKMILGATGNWFKPGDWYERTQFVEEPDGSAGRSATGLSAPASASRKSARKRATTRPSRRSRSHP